MRLKLVDHLSRLVLPRFDQHPDKTGSLVRRRVVLGVRRRRYTREFKTEAVRLIRQLENKVPSHVVFSSITGVADPTGPSSRIIAGGNDAVSIDGVRSD